MTRGGGLAGELGRLAGDALAALRDAVAAEVPLAARALALEQSNSSVLYGDRFLLKLFRVIEEGPNSRARDRPVPRRARGRLPRRRRGSPACSSTAQPGHEPSTLGTLFEFVPNQGDAWQLTLDALDRYFDRVLDRRRAAPRRR